jgi:hypothetical protein
MAPACIIDPHRIDEVSSENSVQQPFVVSWSLISGAAFLGAESSRKGAYKKLDNGVW